MLRVLPCLAVRRLLPLKFDHTLQMSTKNSSPELCEQLIRQIEEQKNFEHIDINSFKDLHNDDLSKKQKLAEIIDIYDNMKYGLENVPSTLTRSNLLQLYELENSSDIKRLITKLYRREFDALLRKNLKMYENTQTTKLAIKYENSEANRAGIFDSSGNLTYGLWHNTLTTRIPKQTRFYLDRLRNAELFGQDIYLDFSFSKHLNYHLSGRVAYDIAKMVKFNRHLMKDPFRLTFCGVDYDHHLWKILSKSFINTLEWTNHTEKSYLDVCPSISNIVYVTNFERKQTLEYKPDTCYVMAALSEKDIQVDFLTPTLRKYKVKQQGIPIDRHVLWHTGSKRFDLFTRLNMLNDIRDNKGWKETLLNNIKATNLKTEQQIREEDYKRWSKLKSNKQTKIKR